ncbi:MAG: hypothetical protein NC203_03060 [Firmicutes bacterium]|nr:hypothetical protein [[Eubacterium] siraeum]MCM1487324.1 hypothetical protein [Bacillota bacterium]
MKKATIIVLIAFVIAVLAGVVFFLYAGSSDLTYVCDYQERTSSSYASALVIKRLYSSNIDQQKTEEFSENLLTTEFSEEELLDAALKAGKPEFYPWFLFQMKKPFQGEEMILEGKMGQTLFDDQKSSRYTVSNLKMELTCEDLEIDPDTTEIYGTEPPLSEMKKTVPVISEDGSSLAAMIDKVGSYEISFKGGSGTIMVQYTFDVAAANGIISRTVLEDQLIQIYITVATAEDGTITAEYEVVEGYQVSDIY